MEAEIFYFVESCNDLTQEQENDALLDFFEYMTSKHICTGTGLFVCSIEDLSIHCGADVDDIESYSRVKREAQSSRLSFRFNVVIAAVPRTAVNCTDICVRSSYCEERCSDNFKTNIEDSILGTRKLVTELFNSEDIDQSEGQLPPSVSPPLEIGGLRLSYDGTHISSPQAYCELGHIPSNGTCGKTWEFTI